MIMPIYPAYDTPKKIADYTLGLVRRGIIELKVSKYFSISELTYSQKAKEAGHSNLITEFGHLVEIARLAKYALDPIREYYQEKLIVNSGYRDSFTNSLVKGTANSDHKIGKAADISLGCSNISVAEMALDLEAINRWTKFYRDFEGNYIPALSIAHVIYERYFIKIPKKNRYYDSSWLHVCYDPWLGFTPSYTVADFDGRNRVSYKSGFNYFHATCSNDINKHRIGTYTFPSYCEKW